MRAWQSSELSPQQLSASLASVNILSSGGDIISGRERIALEPTGNFESIEDLQRTVILLPGGALVYPARHRQYLPRLQRPAK